MDDQIVGLIMYACTGVFSYCLVRTTNMNTAGKWISGIVLFLVIGVLGYVGLISILIGEMHKYVAFAALAVSYAVLDKGIGPKIGGLNLAQEIACSISFSLTICGLISLLIL